MKPSLIFLLLFLTCGYTLPSIAQNYQDTQSGIRTTIDGIDIELRFYSESCVRILKSPQNHQYKKESLSVIDNNRAVNIEKKQKGDVLILKTPSMHITLDLKSGQMFFYNAQNRLLLKEKGKPVFTDFNDAGDKTFSVSQKYALEKDESIYGLGQLQNGKMKQRNLTKYLIQGNVENVVTFFQSNKGYGVFWDNYSPTTFKDDQEETSFTSEVGDCVDYYFMYGGNSDGVIAQMRELTGQVPMFPLWTYGFWQSKERYKSQDETVGVVKKYRDLGVPLDGIIQDWQYWGHNYLWNAMDFQNPLFSDPQKMVDDIHSMNAHMIISIWSSFGPATKPYRELDKNGLLFNFTTWPQSGMDTWPPNMDYPSGVRVYDAYSPKARDIYWKYLNSGLFKYGIDGWWMDSTEPDHLDWKPEDMDTKTYLGSFRKVRNAFPLMTVGGVYDHQRATSSDKRVFILTRSGFAGQQRYGANVWSGDVSSSWESLRNQVPAGLNFSICGLPHWNSDIGGFFAGAYNKTWNDGSATRNPMFQELYVRWLQFGAFNPMMRSHGTDTPREIYHFGTKGEPIYDAIEKTINLRYTLLPYIYSTSWEVTNKQSSFMRALVMDFPNDPKALDLNDEFMFGKSILVAPIVKAQYTPEKIVKVNEEEGWNRDSVKDADGNMVVDFKAKKRTQVYLPAGTTWYDFWTNRQYKGGQRIELETSIDNTPLFIKAGSIIPFGPKVQYTTEKQWDHLQLRVYPGANGSFVLYEDEFDNYNYEKGEYTEIPITWNNASRTLTIGDRKGAYKGMLLSRKFTILLQDATEKTVEYDGNKLEVKL
ncbi:MAG: DUF5110 domain-containing protein [Dysgonomonas mossii]|nr:DUF5110 domain-containing protein [Dysgonomonas mossii]